MQKGSIRVQTENIFPIIKKFLYSEHDIFLRELVSNAVDATQKLKTLSSIGEAKGEMGELRIDIKLDAVEKTITISANRQNIDLGKIILKKDEHTLDTFVVESDVPIQIKGDTTQFNASEMVAPINGCLAAVSINIPLIVPADFCACTAENNNKSKERNRAIFRIQVSSLTLDANTRNYLRQCLKKMMCRQHSAGRFGKSEAFWLSAFPHKFNYQNFHQDLFAGLVFFW